MRSEVYPLNVVQDATGAGDPRPVADMNNKTVEITGIAGGASIQIEGTVSGVSWFPSSAGAFTSDGLKVIPEKFARIRTNRTVQGTGNPVVTVIGDNIRD